MKNLLPTLLILLLLASCQQQTTEKSYTKWKPAIDVSKKIKTIHTPHYMSHPELAIMDDILLVNEYEPSGQKQVHLFETDSFKFLGSVGKKGRGPGEMTRVGNLAPNPWTGHFWLTDFAKYVLWRFSLDSALANPNYSPTPISISEDLFMVRMAFLNDSIAMGNAFTPLSASNYQMDIGRLNTKSNETKILNHPVPEYITEKRTNSYIALSAKNDLYARAYIKYDLLTIRKFNGELICNIKGPGWSKTLQPVKKFYSHVAIMEKYIIAAYLGEDGLALDETKRTVSVSPSKLLVFDLEGNHLKTIETQHPISTFAVDEHNQRIVAYFTDRTEPLGYFELEF
jgi:hypothetical protein